MASSSSAPPPRRTWKYDVFPSFSGQDVRQTFLSHLLHKLRSKLNSFIDNDMERGRSIGPELLSAIRESRILIVVLSERYASSKWCLDELVEIHNCSKDQMVIPVFYNVDPSDVRKQTGNFGDIFKETCTKKTEDEKQRWIQALTDVANITGYDSQNRIWENEAEMTEQIFKDVLNKLLTTTDDFADFVGIDAHLERLNSMLCLESEEEVRMVGIVGTSGIGKSTIARALFSRLKSQFEHQAFVSYNRTTHDKKVADIGVKLSWVNQFLSDILGIKDIKIDSLGAVKERLNHKKVLVVLDDVDERLKTLVGEPGWFGNGSKIILVTQDKALLESHGIDLIYEVQFPSIEVAREILCRSAFKQNSSPYGFTKLVDEVTKLTHHLPLYLSVLGSSLGSKKMDWEEMIPMLRNGLTGEIRDTLKFSYDRLDKGDKDLFLCVACLFNGESVNYIKDLLEDGVCDIVKFRLRRLAGKSLIRITTPDDTVEMHNLLHKLGIEIVRQESINDPGKRRFLVDLEDIRDVFTNKTGTDNVLGICLNAADIYGNKPLLIDENSFKGMCNLQFIKFYNDGGFFPLVEHIWKSHRGLAYLPPKLRLLYWYTYPQKYLPSSFKAEYLVELKMDKSKLKRLWKGTLPLQHLKKMDLSWSKDLKKIPNLSKAKKLKVLNLLYCSELMVHPKEVNFESLEHLHLTQCSWFKSFPRNRTLIASLLIENIHRVTHLKWNKCPFRCMPSTFRTEHLVELCMTNSKFKKLWKGVQPLENLVSMNMIFCEDLKEFPDLSKATKLKKLDMSCCRSLEVLPTGVNLESLEKLDLGGCLRLRSFPQISTSIKILNLDSTAIGEVPSWIENMSKLQQLSMSGCESLEVLPTDVNLESLEELDLHECSRLRSFPQISTNIRELNLSETAIEEVPCWIENMSKLQELDMSGCESLKNISAIIFKLRHLKKARFMDCSKLTSFSDASVVATTARITDFLDLPSDDLKYFQFDCCWSLDGNAQEFLLGLSLPMIVFLPCRQVPTYFTHRTSCGNSLVITLPQSSPSHQFLRFKACVVFPSESNYYCYKKTIEIHWRFRGGLNGVKLFDIMVLVKEDHLAVLNFDLADFEHKSRQYDLDYNDMEFEFILINESLVTKCDIKKLDIKECGIRLLDAESGRSKKQMQMTETTSKEHPNSLNGQIILPPPDLELSLLQGEASSTSKITSSSVSFTNNFHGDNRASSST